MKEEPLIPLGMTLTVIALAGAGRAIRAQDHARANIMFRRRIYAQGFTLLSVVAGGLWLQSDRAKRKEVEALQKERENAERRERWVRELEGREEEDRAAREKVRGLGERRRKREEEVERRKREEAGEMERKDEGIGRSKVEEPKKGN
jgi:hypothetical protein